MVCLSGMIGCKARLRDRSNNLHPGKIPDTNFVSCQFYRWYSLQISKLLQCINQQLFEYPFRYMFCDVREKIIILSNYI